MSHSQIDTTNVIMTFGRAYGERIQRVPVSYLFWVVQNKVCKMLDVEGTKMPAWKVVEAEIERRGSIQPQIDISAHAVDRMWKHHSKKFLKNCKKDEGPYAFTVRLCTEALMKFRGISVVNGSDGVQITHKGITFVLDFSKSWPILKTIK